MRNHNPQNHRTRYKSPSLSPDTELAKKAIGVKLPVKIDTVVRAFPDISGFVRAAVIEKLEREGINLEVAIEPTPPPATPKKTRARKTKTKENGANL